MTKNQRESNAVITVLNDLFGGRQTIVLRDAFTLLT